MKRILIYSFCSLCSLLAVAQQINIKGTILDQSKNQTMGFVGVSLLRGDSLVKGTTSNEKGEFVIDNIAIGAYTLKASFVGYETLIKKFTISGKNTEVNLGALAMKEDAKMLKDVEIVTQGSQMKFEVDKKVFSVDQNIAAAGGSISEALQNVPSVDVDTEGNISLRNSSNVEVWINGKPAGLTEENRAQILEQMPAGSVESIEVITNPSAKYSPEGTAGIINLVLKKDRKAGYFGNVTAGVIVPSKSKIGQLGGVNFNYNKGKIDAFFNVGFRNWWHKHEGVTNRRYFENNNTTSSINQEKDFTHNMYGVNGRFGINYRMNDKHSIGISGFGLSGRGAFEDWIGFEVNDSLGNNTSNYERISLETGARNFGNSTLDYSWLLDKKGSEVRSSLSYSFFKIERDAQYLQTILSGLGTNADQIQNLNGFNNNIQFKTDVVKKIGKESKLESGVDFKKQLRESYSDGSNHNGAGYVEVPSMYNSYDYDEQIYAGYATFGSKYKKFSFQGGLRGEKTIVNTTSISSSENLTNLLEDFQLYPSVFCAYNVSKNDEMQFNYTRRIDRPRGRRLNPFHDYSDSTNISYGNPFLKPEFTSAFELNYLHTYGEKDEQNLSASLYYRFTDNVIEQVRFINSGVMNTTYMNVAQTESSGLELISKNSIAKFLNLTTTVNLYYYYLHPSIFEASSTQQIRIKGDESFSWNARILGNMMLSKTFSSQITANYASPKAVPQGETRSSFSVDLGMRKTLFKRTLNLALSVRDVFNTRARITESYSDDFWQYDEFATIGPTVTFNVTYNFGNGDKKKGKNKDRQGDDMNNEQDIEDF